MFDHFEKTVIGIAMMVIGVVSVLLGVIICVVSLHQDSANRTLLKICDAEVLTPSLTVAVLTVLLGAAIAGYGKFLLNQHDG